MWTAGKQIQDKLNGKDEELGRGCPVPSFLLRMFRRKRCRLVPMLTRSKFAGFNQLSRVGSLGEGDMWMATMAAR